MLHAESTAFTKGTNALLAINLLSFDPTLGDLQARLSFKLPVSEVTAQFSPKHNYFLVDELTVTESVLQIKSNAPYASFNNFLPTTYQVDDAGTQFFYPFDHHRTEIRIFTDREIESGKNSSKTESVPMSLDTSLCSFEGYKVTLTPGKDNSPTFIDLHVDLQRTLPIKLFTIFISFLTLLVASGTMAMTIKVARSHSAPDINEMAFCAALLFAFPAIRSAEPFVPPMGVLSDFLGFFWAEAIVAIALIILITCWMIRKLHD
jgi:hypothetical protein